MLLQDIKTELTDFLASGYEIVLDTIIKNFDADFADVDDVEGLQFILPAYNQDFVEAIRNITKETIVDDIQTIKTLKTAVTNAFIKEGGVLTPIAVITLTQKVVTKTV